MFFVGVITNQKNETYIRNKLSKIISSDNIIFINDKNINNIKNIKFELIVIDTKINNKIELRKIVAETKYVLLNVDIEMNEGVINNLDLMIITYGFNSKATFTVSSVAENTAIICLQRMIFDKNEKIIEPQEFQVRTEANVEKYAIIATKIIEILYENK